MNQFPDLQIESEPEPGFVKLRWRIIKHTLTRNGTWNFWGYMLDKPFRRIGMHCRREHGYNGWWRDWRVSVCWWFGFCEFWIQWNFIVPIDEYRKDHLL